MGGIIGQIVMSIFLFKMVKYIFKLIKESKSVDVEFKDSIDEDFRDSIRQIKSKLPKFRHTPPPPPDFRENRNDFFKQKKQKLPKVDKTKVENFSKRGKNNFKKGIDPDFL